MESNGEWKGTEVGFKLSFPAFFFICLHAFFLVLLPTSMPSHVSPHHGACHRHESAMNGSGSFPLDWSFKAENI
jgi:hypothetical protein